MSAIKAQVHPLGDGIIEIGFQAIVRARVLIDSSGNTISEGRVIYDIVIFEDK